MQRIMLSLAAVLIALAASAREYHNMPLAKALQQVEREYKGLIIINFANDQLADLKAADCSTEGLSPFEAVERLIGDNPLKIIKRGKQITLQREKLYVRGRVTDEAGEGVDYAALTMRAPKTGDVVATGMTDEDGFFTVAVPSRAQLSITASRLGFNSTTASERPGRRVDIMLEKQPVALAGVDVGSLSDSSAIMLREVSVNGRAIRNLRLPRTGMAQLSGDEIISRPSVMGEPDLIKVLQTHSGVAQGVELFSGLYVHGGENDQNLFMYQQLPVYHASHFGGIFSAFNTSTVKSVDFYKSAFPAEFGGRVSSITDITTNEPRTDRFAGRLSLGLLAGNAYVTGPLGKRTAFSAGLRRTWCDVLSIPALWIYNGMKHNRGEKVIAHYAFTDLNLRVDHSFSHSVKGSVIGYWGHDRLHFGNRDFNKEDNKEFFNESTNTLSWGNIGAIATLKVGTGAAGNFNFSAYASRYSSKFGQEGRWTSSEDSKAINRTYSSTSNSITDLGLRANYDFSPSQVYRLKAGAEFIAHDYLPEGLTNVLEDAETGQTGRADNDGLHVRATETAVYADNSLTLGSRLALNAGLRGSTFHTQGHTFSSLEPRAGLRISLNDDFSIKAAYSCTAQYAQQIANNYVNLPTDLWQPIPAGGKPLTSDQYSVGFYGNLPGGAYFSAEGWYKDMQNLLEYREGVSVLDPEQPWYTRTTAGRGWAYGMDISATGEIGPVSGSVNYSLMWNWRKFDELNQGRKFPAKFDNRHKFNISLQYHLNSTIDFSATWIYSTGNRMTLALYNYDTPSVKFPDAPMPSPLFPDTYPVTGHEGLGYISGMNNLRMPAYHRLDLGMDIKRTYRNGRRGLWNISLYNAYCHMNTITIRKTVAAEYNPENNLSRFRRKFVKLSVVPIIPSVSYTYFF